ncbi:helix-turn-helix transcriptional regulator [Herbiconiux solani]|uniref:helix-turn-helix transcriptional regulator n=1 Tax=Herbiconiux solani TaxID=661329 RepID=UPI0012EE271A|nr:LuxR C-terminal-related transcriptional regulator [Herbiconiux solani]
MTESDVETGAGLGRRLDALVVAGDWTAVVTMLDQQWALVLSDDPAAVQRAINALPAEALEKNPRWAMALEYVNRFVTNGRTPTTIFRGGGPVPEPTNLLDLLAQLTAKIAAKRAAGRYAEAVEAAQEARTLLDDADDESRATLAQALPEILFQWAMAWEYFGDASAAAREYTESFDAAVATRHRLAEASAAGALAWMHVLAGRNIQARMWLDRLPDSTGAWWSNRASVTARFTRTLLLIDELEVVEARAELAQVSLAGVTERWPAQKYLLALTETDPAGCVDLLTQIDSSAKAQPVEAPEQGAWEPFVAIARSVLLSRLGNRVDARSALDAVDTDRPNGDSGALQVRLWKATTRLATGDAVRARREAAALIRVSTASPRILVGALAVAAASALKAGEADAATTQMRMALHLAEQHRLYEPLTLVPAAELEALLDLVADEARASVPAAMRAALLAERVGPSADPSADPFLQLTPRELAVAKSAASEQSLEDMAAELFVSRNTVKSQLRSVYRKLGISSRTALEELALRHGYL